MTEDRTEADRRALDDSLRRLTSTLGRDAHAAERAALTLRRLVDAWCSRPSSALDQRKALAENRKVAGCEHHATVGIFEPPHTSNPTTVAGNLELPMLLCQFCYQQVRRVGVLPRAEMMEDMHRTGKYQRQHGKVAT